jgi:C-terminal processing protease CtpA/Prc
MKLHVISKDVTDWQALGSRINDIYRSEDKDALQKSIYQILKETNTGHSFYRAKSPPEFIMHRKHQCIGFSYFKPNELHSDIGYVKVSRFSSRSSEDKSAYVKSIREQIKVYRNRAIKGWIVDLSDNSGGNMWPMLAGLAPLLGNGTHGYFVYPNDERKSWSIHKDGSYLNGQRVIDFEEEEEVYSTLPIAIISSGKTSSSGEAILISFKGKYNVKSFGQNSCGLSTANRTFELSNGAFLAVTTSKMMDSKYNEYGHEVVVDVDTYKPIKDASDWILSHYQNN